MVAPEQLAGALRPAGTAGSGRALRSPAAIAQHLVRFVTTNPPGAEAECVGWVRDLLADAGLET
ncbi:hypothetical protein E1091_04105, partial [Micromonospora fluostatini]